MKRKYIKRGYINTNFLVILNESLNIGLKPLFLDSPEPLNLDENELYNFNIEPVKKLDLESFDLNIEQGLPLDLDYNLEHFRT